MFRSKILVGSLVTITSLSAFVLMSTTANAEGEPYSETYTKSALIRVTTSCTMSGTVNTPHLSTISAGSYAEITGETEISTVCNDNGGFAVYAIGFTNDTDGKNVMTNGTAANDITTGTARTGETSNWAMKLTAVQDGDNTPTIENGYSAFSVVPNSYVKVASYPSVTAPSKEVAFTTHYAAYISMSQPADTYEGQVKYVMVHPASESPEVPEPYPTDPCIANPNCDATSGVTLQRAYEIAYTNAHKGMYEEDTAGSDTFHYVNSWNGETYQGNGRDVRFLMQDMTPEICAAATAINSQALVLDIRDQSSYYIVKAADGRCWMQDNLALDLSNSTVLSGLTSSNTNADATALGYLKGTTARNASSEPNSRYATSGASNWVSSYSVSDPLINKAYKDTLPTSYNNVDDSMKSSIIAEQWKVGIYYNFCAASAGSYCFGDGTNTFLFGLSNARPLDESGTSIDSRNDICPAGWRMPTGGDLRYPDGSDTGEYQNLLNAISGKTDNADVYSTDANSAYMNVRAALHLPRSGSIDRNGSVTDLGNKGFFWTSTMDGTSKQNILMVSDTTIHVGSAFYEIGYPIRCINRTGAEL